MSPVVKMSPSTRSKILLGAEEARKKRHGTGECSDDRQHHYVVIGQPGLRSPVCVYCGNKWYRRLTEEEWDKYENYWKNERHVVNRRDLDLQFKIDVDDSRHAWAAGFLDGEGCFLAHIYNNENGKTRVEATASQTDRRPLEVLKNLYGGSIYWSKSLDDTRKHSGKWSVHSAISLRRILPVLIPYLTVKKEQGEVLLDLCNIIGGKGRHSTFHKEGNMEERERLVNKLSDLKKENNVPRFA